MKKYFSIFLLVVLSFFMVACGPTEDEKNGGNDDVELDIALDSKYEGLLKDKKVYLTTVGQADIDIVENILITANVSEESYERKNSLLASEVQKDGVVLLVLGTSGKGLGAAGTDLAGEEARAKDFMARASAGEITVIALHVGGDGRRGTQTDPIIKVVAPKADLLLVVNTGNKDGLFTTQAKSNNVDLYLFSKASTLKEAFTHLYK